MNGDLDAVLRVVDVNETPGRWAWLADDEPVLRRLALRLEVERLRAEGDGRQPFDDIDPSDRVLWLHVEAHLLRYFREQADRQAVGAAIGHPWPPLRDDRPDR